MIDHFASGPVSEVVSMEAMHVDGIRVRCEPFPKIALWRQVGSKFLELLEDIGVFQS